MTPTRRRRRKPASPRGRRGRGGAWDGRTIIGILFSSIDTRSKTPCGAITARASIHEAPAKKTREGGGEMTRRRDPRPKARDGHTHATERIRFRGDVMPASAARATRARVPTALADRDTLSERIVTHRHSEDAHI